ncbi:MAG: HAD family hydrolase [Terriglobales bacterium]
MKIDRKRVISVTERYMPNCQHNKAWSGDGEMKSHTVVFSIFLTLIIVSCSTTPNPNTPPASTPTAVVREVEKLSGADPLSSWNDGNAKQAIIAFVKTSTDKANPNFVPPEDRIATFDQDGTTWVEHPMYTQLQFIIDRVHDLSAQHPEWSSKPLFRGLLIGDVEAIAKATDSDLAELSKATQVDMPVEQFHSLAKDWITTAKDKRYDKLYTQLVYQPMLEVMQYLRDNGYRTYIVTGGGQEFVRAYSQQVYGIPTDEVIGSALETQYGYDKDGRAILSRRAKLLLDNNNQGKAQDIYLFLGKRPHAAFGNSTGDQQMLEYTQGVGGATLEMLVLHDDAQREYAYGPAQGLPDTHFGKFSQALYDEAKGKGWTVISMKNDWKKIFAWEK